MGPGSTLSERLAERIESPPAAFPRAFDQNLRFLRTLPAGSNGWRPLLPIWVQRQIGVSFLEGAPGNQQVYSPFWESNLRKDGPPVWHIEFPVGLVLDGRAPSFGFTSRAGELLPSTAFGSRAPSEGFGSLDKGRTQASRPKLS